MIIGCTGTAEMQVCALWWGHSSLDTFIGLGQVGLKSMTILDCGLACTPAADGLTASRCLIGFHTRPVSFSQSDSERLTMRCQWATLFCQEPRSIFRYSCLLSLVSVFPITTPINLFMNAKTIF